MLFVEISPESYDYSSKRTEINSIVLLIKHLTTVSYSWMGCNGWVVELHTVRTTVKLFISDGML